MSEVTLGNLCVFRKGLSSGLSLFSEFCVQIQKSHLQGCYKMLNNLWILFSICSVKSSFCITEFHTGLNVWSDLIWLPGMFPLGELASLLREQTLGAEATSHTLDGLQADTEYVISLYPLVSRGNIPPTTLTANTREYTRACILYYSILKLTEQA